MNDRVLLNFAAKAIGIKIVQPIYTDDTSFELLTFEILDGGKYKDWNPLTDDGDALRLAVELHIDLCINNSCAEAVWMNESISETHNVKVACDESFEGWGAKYAATRRAIVQAAAEIGRKRL